MSWTWEQVVHNKNRDFSAFPPPPPRCGTPEIKCIYFIFFYFAMKCVIFTLSNHRHQGKGFSFSSITFFSFITHLFSRPYSLLSSTCLLLWFFPPPLPMILSSHPPPTLFSYVLCSFFFPYSVLQSFHFSSSSSWPAKFCFRVLKELMRAGPSHSKV
jgi:hypothetical protein